MHPSASSKDQIRLNEGSLFGASFGLILGDRCMAAGSIGLYLRVSTAGEVQVTASFDMFELVEGGRGVCRDT